MIRDIARAFVFVLIVLLAIAEAQQLDELNEALILRPQ